MNLQHLPHKSRPIQISTLLTGSAGFGLKGKAQHTSLFLKFPSNQLWAGSGLTCLRDKLE